MRARSWIVWFVTLAACGGHSPARSPPDGGSTPTIAVTPSAADVAVGDAPVLLVATVTGSSEPVTWSLVGPGRLSVATGASTEYSPPDALSDTVMITVTAAVSILRAQAGITVHPRLTFGVAPLAREIVSGDAIIWVAGVGPLPLSDGGFISSSTILTKLRASDGAPLGTFPVPSNPNGACGQGMAFDGLNVWLLDCFGGLAKVRGDDGTLLGLFDPGPGSIDYKVRGVLFDGASIWAANLDGTVARLRASDGALTGTFAVGTNYTPGGLAFDGNAIWVAGTRGVVTKLRASDGVKLANISIGDVTPIAMAFDGKNVWVASAGPAPQWDGTVTTIEARSGLVLGSVSVGRHPSSVVFDGTYVWVANDGDGSVTKLMASDGSIVATLLSVGVQALAFDGFRVWACCNADSVFRL